MALSAAVLASTLISLAGCGDKSTSPSTVAFQSHPGGAVLAYDVTGEGHPLVLIHGGFLDRRMWDDQLEAFARHFQVIRIDLRGYGDSSDDSDAAFSHVEDVRAVLNDLDAGPVYMLGLSMGATVAIDFTTAYPGRVAALVVAGSPLIGIPTSDAEGSRIQTAAVIRAVRRGAVDSAATLALQLPIFRSVSEGSEVGERMSVMMHDNLAGWVNSLGRVRWDSIPAIDRIPSIGVPTLILVGSLDIADMLTAADSLVAGIPGSEKVVVANAGHHVNMEAPEVFTRAVLRFLDSAPLR